MSKRFSSKMLKVKNIEEALRPLKWLNYVAGFAIFEVPAGNPWIKLSVLYVLIRGIFYGVLFYYQEIGAMVTDSRIKILVSVLQVILYANVTITTVTTVLGFLCYKKWKEFYDRITLVDETLEIFGVEPEYCKEFREHVKVVIIWILGGMIVVSTDIFLGYYSQKNIYDTLRMIIVYQGPLLLNPIDQISFAAYLRILGKRFKRLNGLIQGLKANNLHKETSRIYIKYNYILKNNQNKVAVQPNPNSKNTNNIELLLKTARQLHLNLCAIARKINDISSKQISIQMAATFLLMTGFSYSLYLLYNEPNMSFRDKIHQYSTLGMWIVMSILRILHVARTSVNVMTEAQKTSQIAHEIQVPRTQTKLVDEVHQLSLQIMQHPLTFTASGLIVLDFGSIRGIVGSVTTYLMILIQNQPDMLKAANTLAEIAVENNTTAASMS